MIFDDNGPSFISVNEDQRRFEVTTDDINTVGDHIIKVTRVMANSH